MNKIIEEKKDTWTIFYNCSDFAIDVWNSLFDNKQFNKDLIQTPTDLKKTNS